MVNFFLVEKAQNASKASCGVFGCINSGCAFFYGFGSGTYQAKQAWFSGFIWVVAARGRPWTFASSRTCVAKVEVIIVSVRLFLPQLIFLKSSREPLTG